MQCLVEAAQVEAMVVTLRERLDAEAHTSHWAWLTIVFSPIDPITDAARITPGCPAAELAADRAELARMEGQRQELVQQVDGLRTQLAAAQVRADGLYVGSQVTQYHCHSQPSDSYVKQSLGKITTRTHASLWMSYGKSWQVQGTQHIATFKMVSCSSNTTLKHRLVQ